MDQLESAPRPWVGRARWAGRWAALALVAAVLCLPWAVERSVEQASFDDRVGTLPVQVGLAHNGYTTLDTGLLGKIYWQHTGPAGFGAELRSTGPPLAGGTLSSYVSPRFMRANTQFLEDPDQVATTYGEELRRQVVRGALTRAALGGLVLGTLFAAAWPLVAGRSRWFRVVVVVTVAVATAGASVAYATAEFRQWEDDQAVADSYPLSGRDDVSFSSPQAREVAEQIQPFIEKNSARIDERTAAYAETAAQTLRTALALHGADLQPREGEVVVLAEADPQGSLVGTRVRRDMYEALTAALPDGAVVLRTIAGDVTSNGTVAEAGFVDDEVAASGPVPVVAAKGDHDTDTTVDQLREAGATVPDTEVVDVGGLRVASALDPAFKALFGGLVVNESGITETEAGQLLRTAVDDAGGLFSDAGAYDVVLHQPRAVEGYLGVDREAVFAGGTSLTTPVDDGVPDVPAGIVTYGHLHDPAGPWVLWNSDGTWTVVTQLGTAGGVEENPTFNRFSTPFSTPLKALSAQLQYVNPETGLQTGLVPISFATDGTATVGDRIDVGLPGGEPGPSV